MKIHRDIFNWDIPPVQTDAYLSGVKYLARLGLDRPGIQSIIDPLLKAWANLPEGHRVVLRSVLPSQVVPQ